MSAFLGASSQNIQRRVQNMTFTVNCDPRVESFDFCPPQIVDVLWVLMTGCQWYLIESAHGSWQLHYYRFRKLVSLGVFKGEFEKAANEYVAVKGGLACLLIDGTHIKAKTKAAWIRALLP